MGVRARIVSRCKPVAASTAAPLPHARLSSDSARNVVSSGPLQQYDDIVIVMSLVI